MKDRGVEISESQVPRVDESGPPRSNETGAATNKEGVLGDRRLVERCLAGEVGAWEELYERCHPALLLSIEMMMGRRNGDPHLVDEIAARVWYSLVANDGELLARYEPNRGARLITFLRALAKDETSRYYRAESRRREREQVAVRHQGRPQPAPPQDPPLSLTEFLATLTPLERGFCGEYLLSTPSEGGGDSRRAHSPANIWQLTRRIHRKLLSFLDQNS